MTERPDDTIDLPDAQLPGPEDGPVVAPREPDPLPTNDGDLDVGDTPTGGDTGDAEAPAFDRSR